MSDESWLKTISDEDRAVFLKTRVSESEETKRIVAKEREETRRTRSSGDYQIVQAVKWAVLLLIATCATCVASRQIEAWQVVELAQIRSKESATTAPTASASASASSAKVP